MSGIVRLDKVSKIVITIDGLAGSGKSTIAREIARRRGLVHLNSGMLYRAAALLGRKSGVPLDEGEKVSAFVSMLKLEFQLVDKSSSAVICANGELLEEAELSSVQAGQDASKIAVYPYVRELLTEAQRKAISNLDLSVVLEGRDAGTVVFPDAPFKFYLKANIDERVNRRLKEVSARDKSSTGQSADDGIRFEFNLLREDLLKRDLRDSTREVAPHVVPENAIVIDSSNLSIDEVVKKIFSVLDNPQGIAP